MQHVRHIPAGNMAHKVKVEPGCGIKKNRGVVREVGEVLTLVYSYSAKHSVKLCLHFAVPAKCVLHR